MPEGDTIWRLACRLHDALAGRTLVRSDVRMPRFATVDLAGCGIVEVTARGKHLLMRLEGESPVTIHSHLKMEGSWRLYRPGQRWTRPGFQARIVLDTPTVQAVGFQLGLLEIISTPAEANALNHLGPDLLGPDWNPEEACRRLEHHGDRPLGSALLDQRNLAGLGNIYANELCFLAGVHPKAPVAAVPDVTRLVAEARRLIHLNRDQPRRVTTGTGFGGAPRYWVYHRARRPCRRCGAAISYERLTQDTAGGNPASRDIYVCPRCQRLP